MQRFYTEKTLLIDTLSEIGDALYALFGSLRLYQYEMGDLAVLFARTLNVTQRNKDGLFHIEVIPPGQVFDSSGMVADNPNAIGNHVEPRGWSVGDVEGPKVKVHLIQRSTV